MERPEDDCPDIAETERRLDENWNERKHLAEQEFDLRAEIQGLIQRRSALAAVEEARGRERACRAALAENNREYDGLIGDWVADAAKSGAPAIAGANGAPAEVAAGA